MFWLSDSSLLLLQNLFFLYGKHPAISDIILLLKLYLFPDVFCSFSLCFHPFWSM